MPRPACRVRRAETLNETRARRYTVRVEENGQSIVQFSQQKFDDKANETGTEPFEGLLPAKARFRDTPLLKVRFVDVGQGDDANVDTAGGRRPIIDGGEQRHIRNYIAAAYGTCWSMAPCIAMRLS